MSRFYMLFFFHTFNLLYRFDVSGAEKCNFTDNLTTIMENTKWYKWKDRNKIENRNQPAVYFIAHSNEDISGNEFSMRKEIVYIGMTISKNGLKGRLDQFENTMKGLFRTHGGAERVMFKHTNYRDFFEKAYISAKIFPLSISRDTPNDWRVKGDCAGHEYKSFADYKEEFKELPEFNDPNKSKKR